VGNIHGITGIVKFFKNGNEKTFLSNIEDVGSYLDKTIKNLNLGYKVKLFYAVPSKLVEKVEEKYNDIDGKRRTGYECALLFYGIELDEKTLEKIEKSAHDICDRKLVKLQTYPISEKTQNFFNIFIDSI